MLIYKITLLLTFTHELLHFTTYLLHGDVLLCSFEPSMDKKTKNVNPLITCALFSFIMLPRPQQRAAALIILIDNIMVAYQLFTEPVAATASSFSPKQVPLGRALPLFWHNEMSSIFLPLTQCSSVLPWRRCLWVESRVEGWKRAKTQHDY